MTKLELHVAQGPYYEIGELSSGKPEKWAPMQLVPNMVDVPEELIARYEKIMGEFWSVQEELRKLYDGGTPANAVRPKQ